MTLIKVRLARSDFASSIATCNALPASADSSNATVIPSKHILPLV
jgi:hypothetical protein